MASVFVLQMGLLMAQTEQMTRILSAYQLALQHAHH